MEVEYEVVKTFTITLSELEFNNLQTGLRDMLDVYKNKMPAGTYPSWNNIVTEILEA